MTEAPLNIKNRLWEIFQSLKAMEGVKEFLESSSIHGLGHVASTRVKLVKLLWIFLVFTGFTVAGFLIQQSFSSWANSPITTTIDTLPISELKFPNVTVCPPRNSFTNLNLDIERTRKISLSQGQRKALSKQISEVLSTSHMERKLATYNEYEEKDKYRNQYHGLSSIQLPTYSGNGPLSRTRYEGEKEIDISIIHTISSVGKCGGQSYLLILKMF